MAKREQKYTFQAFFIGFILLMIGAYLGACSGGSGSGSQDDGSEETVRHFRVGVAPIPRNFPGSQEDWQDMLGKIQMVGEFVTVQNPWRDSLETSGQIPEFIALLGDQQANYGFMPVYGINFFHQSGDYDPLLDTAADPTNDWTNADAKILYTQTARAICAAYHPAYLGLAIEVNSYYLRHSTDFDRFVLFYSQLYDAIKEENPDVILFVTFQLEMMKGIGDAVWGFPVEPHWELLGRFGDRLDLVVFTSYPEVEYNSPEDIPENYYLEILNHTTKPIAFSEIGWSSTKYSEEDQDLFARRFLQLTPTMPMTFVNWIFMHDLPTAGPLTKTGLRASDGTAKSVWNTWESLRQKPYRQSIR